MILELQFPETVGNKVETMISFLKQRFACDMVSSVLFFVGIEKEVNFLLSKSFACSKCTVISLHNKKQAEGNKKRQEKLGYEAEQGEEKKRQLQEQISKQKTQQAERIGQNKTLQKVMDFFNISAYSLSNFL